MSQRDDVILIRLALRDLAQWGSPHNLDRAMKADEALRRLFPEPPAPPRPLLEKPPGVEPRGI